MGEDIRSFRDLVVWQKAMDLVEITYVFSRQFPPDEKYGLTSQWRRAAVSIPSNIAEGYGRHSTADCIRFLPICLNTLELYDEMEKMLISLV